MAIASIATLVTNYITKRPVKLNPVKLFIVPCDIPDRANILTFIKGANLVGFASSPMKMKDFRV